MKKIAVLGAVAVALAVGLPSLAGATGNDVAGPPCADVISGDGFYFSTGAVNVSLELAAPSCSFVTYTVYVLDASGNALATPSTTGNGTDGTLLLSTSVDPSNSSVCVYATTSVGRHVFDRAPDADLLNCVSMQQQQAPGFGGFD